MREMNYVRFIGATVCILVMEGTVACNRVPPADTPSQSISRLVEKLTLDDLAARSHLTVLGEVIEVTYRKDTNGNIYTLTTLSVEQTFKGESVKQVVITAAGGKVDGQMLHVEDAASFQPGERAVIFLEKNNETFTVTGGFQGKFIVDKNLMVDNIPLQEFIQRVTEALARS